MTFTRIIDYTEFEYTRNGSEIPIGGKLVQDIGFRRSRTLFSGLYIAEIYFKLLKFLEFLFKQTISI